MDYEDFIADLINEREQKMNEWDLEILAEYICNSTNMEKKEDIECCCCLETKTCVKLPNCDHFVCPKCCHKIYHGFISDDFYSSYKRPCFGPEKPEYPYKDIEENTEIYSRLHSQSNSNDSSEKSMYERWFINSNEDLYESINKEPEFFESFIKTKPYETLKNIKEWFETDEKIKKYEEKLVKFYIEYKLFEEKNDLYERLCEEERKKNCVKKCPLCRQ